MQAVPNSVLTMATNTVQQCSSSSPADSVGSAEQLGHIIYLAAVAEDWSTFDALCQWPTAQQLSTDRIAHVLPTLLPRLQYKSCTASSQCHQDRPSTAKQQQPPVVSPSRQGSCITWSNSQLNMQHAYALGKFLQLPGAQHFSPGSLTAFLKPLADKPAVWVPVLYAFAAWLPGAQQWSVGYIHQAAKRILHKMQDATSAAGRATKQLWLARVLRQLLCLRHAQELSTTDVQQLLQQAEATGCVPAVEQIHIKLPGHAALSQSSSPQGHAAHFVA